MKKLLQGLLVMLLLSSSAHAYFLTNWGLAIDGNEANKQLIGDFIDLNGYSYVENSIGTNGITFKEVSAFKATDISVSTSFVEAFPGWQLTAFLSGFGTVEFGGEFNFTGGTVDLYAYNFTSVADTDKFGNTGNFYGSQSGTKFATFDILSGSGSVGFDLTPSGSSAIQLVGNSLLPGYMFDSYGNDLFGLSNINWLIAVSNVTNTYNPYDPNDPQPADLAIFASEVSELLGYNVTGTPPGSLFVNNGGEFRPGIVPEPSTMLLLGAGLLGFAAVGRRARKN